MTLSVVVLIGSAVSAVCLVMLALLDPKRRRALRGRTDIRLARWLLTAAVLAPGLPMAAGGRGVALVIWFGAICMFGWILALLINRGAPTEIGSSSEQPERT